LNETVEITAYIFIERPTPSVLPKRGSGSRKTSDEDKYKPHGLLTFNSDTPYFSFLFELSRHLPCSVSDIVEDKMTWRFQTPQKSPVLSLARKVGYDSMVSQNKDRKSGRIISLMMPPPQKPAVEKQVSLFLILWI
jgi:hypothetical protein